MHFSKSLQGIQMNNNYVKIRITIIMLTMPVKITCYISCFNRIDFAVIPSYIELPCWRY